MDPKHDASLRIAHTGTRRERGRVDAWLIILAVFCWLMNAGSAATYGFFTYTVNGGKVTITDYPTTKVGVVDIPSTIPEANGLPVTSIGANAFYGCSKLTSVTIPEGVVSIGGSAFHSCTALESVTIPDSVTSIGNFAFAFSGLTNVDIPVSATSIGSSAFYSCAALENVTIPEGVTRIQSDVFYGCTSLASVKIPSTVIVIDAYAFYDCSSLTSVEIPANVTSIGNWAFYGCHNQTCAYFRGNAPTHMGTSVFDANDSEFTVYYVTGKTGFSLPTWKGYPVDTTPSCTLTYNANGGSGATTDPISCYAGDTITLGNQGSMVKTGYTFGGWNKKADGSGTTYSEGAAFVITVDTTLYATWTATKYTVTFDEQSGTTPDPTTKDVTYAATYGTLAITSRAGYTFGGWWTRTNGTGTQVTDITTVTITAAQTLYAKWWPGVSYATWASELASGENGPSQTPWNDGVSNLIKFACNMNANTPDFRKLILDGAEDAGLPAIGIVEGKLRMEFIRRKNSTNPGITYTPQFSSDLDSWANSSTETVIPLSPVSDIWERVRVNDTESGLKRFGRLRVTQVP